MLVWNAAERVLYNEFIETADEYGISRFEKILNILPSKEDTLESRRARVQARWFNTIPYTMKSFLAKLIALCGDSDFTVTKEYEKYKVEILTNLELFGQVEELERIIDSMIPCNMIVISLNEIPCGAAGFAFIAGGVCSVEHFFITNDEQTKHTISNGAIFGGGTVHTAHYFVTNDSKENVAVDGSALHGGGAVNSVSVIITNDFNEQFNISGENSVGSGVIASEFIEIKQ